MPAQCALLPTKQTSDPPTPHVLVTGSSSASSWAQRGPVAESGRGSGHPADEQRPQVGAVVAPGADGGHGVQGAARGVEVAGFAGQGEQPGGDRVRVRGNPHPASDRFGGGGTQLVWYATGPRQHQQLTGLDVHGVGLADPFTQRARLVDQLPGLVELSVDQRECAAAGQGHVVVAGLAEALGEVEVFGQDGSECRRAGFEQGGGGEQDALGVPLRVCGAHGQICDLPGQVYPLCGLGTIRRVKADEHAVDVARRHGTGFLLTGTGGNQEIVVDPRTYHFAGYQFLGSGRDIHAAGAWGMAILRQAFVPGPGIRPSDKPEPGKP
jgi:hypothetical protein